MELAWRLGSLEFRLEYRPAALAYHARGIDLEGFCRRMANEAESAVLLRAICPEFPLDESERVGVYVRRRWRLLMGLAAPLAAALGRDRFLDRHYRARISAAYLEGGRRAGPGTHPRAALGNSSDLAPVAPRRRP